MSKRILTVAVLLALPAAALAQDWKGITTDWDDIATNWSSSPDASGYKTEKASVDPGDVTGYGGTFMPVIDDTNNTTWGWARIRNGAAITQTGGYHRWINGTGDSAVSFYMYNGSTQYTHLDISGGTHVVNGRMHLGYNGATASPNGTTAVNISGDGVVELMKSPFTNATLYDLKINTNSQITIADMGKLIVHTDLGPKVEEFGDQGRIVAEAGKWLDYAYDWDNQLLTVTAIPEPASLLLVALGGVLMRRRRV